MIGPSHPSKLTRPRARGCNTLHAKTDTRVRVAALAAWLFAWPLSTAAQAVEPISFEVTGRFSSEKVKESSGVAVSRSQPGVLWTHNDSGDKARLFATNARGSHLAVYDVRGAKANDWEDIAAGPCPGGDGPCLYIADTGDNGRKRRRVTVYVVPEPAIDEGTKKSRRTAKAHELKIRYPDGPRDVEALAVSPEGDILLISKGQRGAIVVLAVPGHSARERAVTARVVDTLPIVPQMALGRWVTGAALSPSGRRLAVRTYTEIYFFDRDASGTLQAGGPPCWLGTRQPNGEAVDFVDEETVVLTSEARRGRPGSLALARCPP